MGDRLGDEADAGIDVEYGWVGYLEDFADYAGFTADYKVPGVEDVFVLTGLGSLGFEQGMMAGRLGAEWVQEGRASSVLLEAGPGEQVALQDEEKG